MLCLMTGVSTLPGSREAEGGGQNGGGEWVFWGREESGPGLGVGEDGCHCNLYLPFLKPYMELLESMPVSELADPSRPIGPAKAQHGVREMMSPYLKEMSCCLHFGTTCCGIGSPDRIGLIDSLPN